MSRRRLVLTGQTVYNTFSSYGAGGDARPTGLKFLLANSTMRSALPLLVSLSSSSSSDSEVLRPYTKSSRADDTEFKVMLSHAMRFLCLRILTVVSV
jgi:hypothetical protein